MASRFFNIFRRGSRQYVASQQTLVACQKRFFYGVQEINLSQQNLKKIYETIGNLIRINQVKLQLAEELIDKMYEQMSSLACVAGKLRDQIEKDEKRIEERKKIVFDIHSEIINLRSNLDRTKDEYGFSEWVEKNKEGSTFLKEYKSEREVVEMEVYKALKRMQRLSEAHDETDHELDRLQDIRDKYIETNEEDMKMLAEKLVDVRIKRKLFAIQPLENIKEVITTFSCVPIQLEENRQELLKIRTAKSTQKRLIDSQKEEYESLTLRNEELMFKVMNDKEELEKIQKEKIRAKRPDVQAVQFADRMVFNTGIKCE